MKAGGRVGKNICAHGTKRTARQWCVLQRDTGSVARSGLKLINKKGHMAKGATRRNEIQFFSACLQDTSQGCTWGTHAELQGYAQQSSSIFALLPAGLDHNLMM